MYKRQVSNLLNKKSGVLGISGVSSDMRELLAACAAGNEKAILAEKMYYYRIKKYIGAYAAALGGVDIILFTGGVGENQMECRREVCKDMEYMGIELDNDINAKVRGEVVLLSSEYSLLDSWYFSQLFRSSTLTYGYFPSALRWYRDGLSPLVIDTMSPNRITSHSCGIIPSAVAL